MKNNFANNKNFSKKKISDIYIYTYERKKETLLVIEFYFPQIFVW